MYVVCRLYVCSRKMANQSLLSILSRVWIGGETSAKSVKGKDHEQPNGESVVGSGMEKTSKLLSAPRSLTLRIQVFLW